CRKALEFISEHGHEYKLLTREWGVQFAERRPMPAYEFIQDRLAEELGGTRGDHARLALELVTLVHGTAMLRPEKDEHEHIDAEFQSACLEACDALIADAKKRMNGEAN